MALNLDLKSDNGMDLSLPSPNNTSQSETPQKTNCERLQTLTTDIKKFVIIIENFKSIINALRLNGITDERNPTLTARQLPKSSSLRRATPTCGKLAPNFLFPISIQILSTANGEETHSTATSNKIAPSTLCHTEPADAYVIPYCTILTTPSPHRSLS
ncbi:hypothetical protein TNIN_134221 [Trichonephila inaurata madagascariensis]|uniref:Uncharacterized protein n=1 Tax=Trichonephila inaurata madagascariensis TaxID=2747483 RepID=A0A8X6WSM4_9ARAC|nr:hypothetical protein TNIN_134221 [Trichonephila inaurata madagascariensis]